MRISDWSSDVCSSDLNEADPGACVHATYQSAGALFWHNVSWVCDDMIPSHAVGDLNIRSGLPHGVDALKLGVAAALAIREARSEEHPSELQSLMRRSYAVFCWKKKSTQTINISRRE